MRIEKLDFQTRLGRSTLIEVRQPVIASAAAEDRNALGPRASARVLRD
jgi:hypothetical protein